MKSYPELPLRISGVLVIVGGGAIDLELLKRLKTGGATVIAADGGADTCGLAGIVPEAIVGDLDSLSDFDKWSKKTKIYKISEQDTTDFEKSLYVTQAQVTIGLGMTGKRFDHTLAALDTVARYAPERHIILVDEKDLALAVWGAFSFAVGPGERVSIHPLGEVCFARSDGLKYPLDGLTLAPGVRTGTSNAAAEGPFSIVPAEGETAAWLLLIGREHLDALIAALR